MTGPLKPQRLLVAAGFVVVGIAFGGQIAVIDYHSGFAFTEYEMFFGAASTLGYGLLAVATWVWFKSLAPGSYSGLGLTTVLKLFAVANLAFAIGLVAVTYFFVHQAISLPYDGRLGIAVPTTYGLQLFGFCLVSAAFWSAARVVQAGAGDVDRVEGMQQPRALIRTSVDHSEP